MDEKNRTNLCKLDKICWQTFEIYVKLRNRFKNKEFYAGNMAIKVIKNENCKDCTRYAFFRLASFYFRNHFSVLIDKYENEKKYPSNAYHLEILHRALLKIQYFLYNDVADEGSTCLRASKSKFGISANRRSVGFYEIDSHYYQKCMVPEKYLKDYEKFLYVPNEL